MRVTFKRRHSNRMSASSRREETLTGDVVYVHDGHLPLRDRRFIVSVRGWLGGHTVLGRHLLTVDGEPVSPDEPERLTPDIVTDEQLTVLYSQCDNTTARYRQLVESLTVVVQALASVLEDHEDATSRGDESDEEQD